MEMIFKNIYFDIFQGITFDISKNKITGITGDNIDYFIDYFKTINHKKGSIYFNKEKQNDLNSIRNKVGIVENTLKNEYLVNTVKEYMLLYIRSEKLNFRDYNKKIKDALRITTLNESYLDKNIKELSTSEKKLLALALILIKNSQIIVLKDYFNGLDMKTEKKLILVFKKLTDNYHKTILIGSNDSDLLYRLTNKVLIIKDRGVFLEGHTTDVYEDNVETLLMNNIDIPEIVLFTYKAKTRKNVKIDYHIDIRDLIKDIYKHI